MSFITTGFHINCTIVLLCITASLFIDGNNGVVALSSTFEAINIQNMLWDIMKLLYVIHCIIFIK